MRLLALLAVMAGACRGPDAATPDASAHSDAPHDTATASSFAVATINLRCLIDDWDARLPILADELATANIDVHGLQESCTQPGGRDQLEELVAALASRGAGPLATARTTTHLAWDVYGEGLAIISRYPIADISVHALPAGAFPRKLLAAELITPGGPRIVAVTHLDHQSTATRAAQIATVVAALDEFARGTPIVFVGDLNEVPGGNVTTTLETAGFIDAWSTARPGEPGHTHPADAPTRRIDYVWSRGVGTARAAELLLATPGGPSGTTYASDHLAVMAMLASP
jgi:endonuclease/exonuclease/phosphatase family metal-dependent hydrolase